MKILLIHSYYTLRGGEDAVFEQEAKLLARKNDVEVLCFYNQSGIKGALQFLGSIWNIQAAKKVAEKLEQFKPQVVHIHNWHFATGPLVFRTISKRRIPVVVTLHNYRMICPSATFLINGEIAINSLNAFPWYAIRNKAYRGSFFLTFWLAFTNWFHNKIRTWNKVDKYIVLTQFARNLYTKSKLNLDSNKFIIKSNFVEKIGELEIENRLDHFLFIGRLSKEKGIVTLLEVFRNSKFKLRIAGDGPLKDHVLKIEDEKSNITYLGSLSKIEIMKELKQCTALVFPSQWYEGMPMTIIEALSTGTPVIASDLGAMSSMVKHEYNGLLFNYQDEASLFKAITYWATQPNSMKGKMQKNAYLEYENKFTPQKNIVQLNNIYESVNH
ncbi:glycosyltransferase family 4 protein [Leeuwenhoekiella sp. A2]|uniref:glycosyltransferase family 4 protein n=1 Tax=Leeuwenhoekiella sp. A2 TaxID=3141460 RepID=UPI003A802901